jgi:hypothetical protein
MTGMVDVVQALRDKLAMVRFLHVERVEADAMGGMRRVCRECRTAWPCATFAVVRDDD